jgi:hypothetical protein
LEDIKNQRITYEESKFTILRPEDIGDIANKVLVKPTAKVKLTKEQKVEYAKRPEDRGGLKLEGENKKALRGMYDYCGQVGQPMFQQVPESRPDKEIDKLYFITSNPTFHCDKAALEEAVKKGDFENLKTKEGNGIMPLRLAVVSEAPEKLTDDEKSKGLRERGNSWRHLMMSKGLDPDKNVSGSQGLKEPYLVSVNRSTVLQSVMKGETTYAIISYRWNIVLAVKGYTTFDGLNEKVDGLFSVTGLDLEVIDQVKGGVIIDTFNHLNTRTRKKQILAQMCENYGNIPVIPLFIKRPDIRANIHRGWVLQEVFGTKFHPITQSLNVQGFKELKRITHYKRVDLRREVDMNVWARALLAAMDYAQYSSGKDRYFAPIARLRRGEAFECRHTKAKYFFDGGTKGRGGFKLELYDVKDEYKDDKPGEERWTNPSDKEEVALGESEKERESLARAALLEYRSSDEYRSECDLDVSAPSVKVVDVLDYETVAPQYCDAVAPYLESKIVPTTLPPGLRTGGLGPVKQGGAVATSYNTYTVISGASQNLILVDSNAAGNPPSSSNEDVQDERWIN